MKKAYRMIAHATLVVVCLIFYLLPGSKYEWVQDIDPSVSGDAFAEPSDNRALVTFLLLMLVILFQSGLILYVRNRREQVLSGVLIGLVTIAWFAKFR